MSVSSLYDLLAAPGGVRGRRVFVRADLNVPLDHGKVADDSRIRASLPTLQVLLDAGARVIVASHLGRPKGERKPELSLRPVAEQMASLLGHPVTFCEDCIGDAPQQAAAELADGQLLMLENLRFYNEETKNDSGFAKQLAELADDYVNDAFGTAHRAHASTAGMVEHAQRAAAGDLMRRELEQLKIVIEPERPLLCFLGGAKVSDKLAALESLVERADVIAVGGAMAYTFLRARGETTGDSLVEEDRVEDAKRLMASAEASGHRLLLPEDHLVANRLEPDAETQVCKEIPEGWLGVDIGPETAASYAKEAAAARTIFWNGPMGVFEMERFAKGTEAVAKAVADSAAKSVVGGGDSLAAVARVGIKDRITHLSTGGGASLEFVQGIRLPGVVALENHS